MMKAYPEYKESGINWIGDIPNHFNLVKMKYLCDIQTGEKDTVDADPEADYDFYVRSKKIYKISSYSFDCKAVLMPGDGDVGNIFHYVDGKFDFHQRVYMMNNFANTDSRFFYYYLSGLFIRVAKDGSAKTTVDSLRLPTLKNFWFTLPSLLEQENIAKFLDVNTSRIDNLIAEKENFIKLLSEKRQALISHVVTKGLNPNVPMKDSGVEWIGEIPEHWEVSPIKHYISSVKSGTSVNAANVPASENEIGVLKTSCVSSGEFNYKQNKTVISEDLDRVTCKVESRSLIVSRMNTPELVGAAGYVRECPDNIYLPDRLWQLNAIENLENEYIHFWTQSPSYRTQVNLCCIGTSDSMQNLSQEKFKNFYIAIPPIEEQIKLIEEVNKQSFLLEKIKSETINSIELLKEHRTALISAAVTGKIDVREIA